MKIRIIKAPNNSNKYNLGGNFSNGVTQINAGGLHSTNPNEGVLMGHDENFVPNLVEEGEVIWNDYVFSNRLRVPKAIRQKYKLRGTTFADAAKQTQKESEERPNDPISKNGLDAQMNSLMEEQEMIREAKNKNKYAKRGKLFAIGGDKSAKTIADEAMEKLYKNSGNYVEPLSIASKIEGSTVFKDNIKDSPLEGITGVAPIKESPLRYAPIMGAFAATMNDVLGGNEPDYTNANLFQRAIEGTNRSIGFTPSSDYMTYKPVDIERYKNRLDANAAANRSTIKNTSGGNRAAYLTGLLASDYNYGNQLGELMGNVEGINFNRYKEAKAYNKNTNLANAEMAMKADMANAEQAMQRARMYGSLAEYRDAIKAKNRAEKSANLTNFIQGISDLGKEKTDRDMLRWLADLGVLTYDTKGKYTGKQSAYGGKINRKKRGGFTV